MVVELLVKYSESLEENKITGEIYKVLKKHGIEPLEIISNYVPKFETFHVKYLFSENKIKLSTIEGLLNNTNLLKKVEILNDLE